MSKNNITLLSCDIQGSTALIQGLDVEEARALLGERLEFMINATEFFNGKVIETGGDGILASFTSSEAYPESAIPACLAALLMQDLMIAKPSPAKARVGLNTIHTSLTQHFMKETNLVEKEAAANTVQLSESTYEILKSQITANKMVSEKNSSLITYRLNQLTGNLKELYVSKYTQYQKNLNPQGKGKINLEEILIGERKVISILFIKYNNQDIEKISIDAIKEQGGTLLKTSIGNALAVFGAPIAYEDHASRACRAALYIKERVNIQLKKFELAMGIHSGEAVVDLIGGERLKSYDALGASVSLAARMEQSAENNQVNVSQHTEELVKKDFELKKTGAFEVKGFNEPIITYELIREKSYREKTAEFSTPHSATPLIGRDTEMQVFQTGLGLALKGHGQVIELLSQAGGGKSRLIYEYKRLAKSMDITISEAACFPASQSTPLYPVIQLMKMSFGIDEKQSQKSQVDTIKNIIKKHHLKNEFTLESFCYLFDFPISNSKWDVLQANQKFKVLLKNSLDFFTNSDLVYFIIFEDIHWSDPQTLIFIDHLIEGISHAHIIIGLNYREEEFKGKLVKTNYCHALELSSLSIDDSMKLLSYLIPHDGTVDDLLNSVSERCDGNPFFLKETAKSLIEEGIVSIKNKKYSLTEKGEQYVLPQSVRTLLNSRIDRLEKLEKRILQAASIIGRVFEETILFLLESKSSQELLDKLVMKEFIFELESNADVVMYEFNHALTLDAVYNDMLKSTRIFYHKTLAEKLEEFEKDNLDKYSTIIAEHAEKGETYDKAFLYYNKAAPKRMNMGLYREAIKVLQKADECFQKIELPDTNLIERYIYNKCFLMHYKPMMGITSPYSEMDESSTINLTKKYLNEKILVFLYVSYSIEYSNNGYINKSFEMLHKAGELESKLKDIELHDFYLFFLEYAYQISGEYEKCEKVSNEIFRDSQDLAYFPYEAPVYGGAIYHQSYAYADQGLKKKCYDLIQHGMNDENKTDAVDHSTVCVPIAGLVPYLIFGDLERFHQMSEHAFHRYQPVLEGFLSIILIPCMAMYEALQEGQPKHKFIDQATEMFLSMPTFVYKVSYSATWLIEASLLFAMKGKTKYLDNARLLLERLSVFCANGETKTVLARYLKEEAKYIMVKNGFKPNQKVEDYLLKALSITKEIQMHSETAFVTAELALYYKHYKNDQDQAKQFYDEAIKLYKKHGMDFWGERLVKEYQER